MALEHKINSNLIGRAASFFRKYAVIAALGIGMSLFAYSCGGNEGCQYDTQCSQNRVCISGECVQDPNYNPDQNNLFPKEDAGYEEDIASDAGVECDKHYRDADGDGFGNKVTWSCEQMEEFVENNSDCDDNDSNIGGPITCNYDGTGCGDFQLCVNICPIPPQENPCDNVDNNCNGQVDENKDKQFQQTCSNGKVHWQDECGNLGAIIETCLGNTNCNKTCVGNEVHWQNECGGIEALVEACNAKTEACIDGVCECQPNCTSKECGDDGCGGSCGECEPCQKCEKEKCNDLTYVELLNLQDCSVTDSVYFSYNGTGHNLKKSCMESGEYACSAEEGLKCVLPYYYTNDLCGDSQGCWTQWDMKVATGSDALILILDGITYYYTDMSYAHAFYIKIDQQSIEAYYPNSSEKSGEGWKFECTAPRKGVIKTIANGPNISADGTVTLQAEIKDYDLDYISFTNLLSSAQIYSCTCPKGE